MESVDRKQTVYDYLDRAGIRYTHYDHPETPTIEIARQYWRQDGVASLQESLFPEP